MVFKLKQPVSAGWLCDHAPLELLGDRDKIISSVAPFDLAERESLSFWGSNSAAKGTGSRSVFIAKREHSSTCTFSSNHPRLDFIRALSALSSLIGFSDNNLPKKIDPSANIGQNAFIANDVTIGANTTVEPNVCIFPNTHIGRNCIIRASATIGSSGFGFEREDDGTPIAFPHLGGVIIGDNVEIGACTCIAQGTLGNTVIQDNVKIDNLVHVAHNCIIERNVFLIACAELSGGVRIKENSWVAPNASVNQKICVGANSLIGLGAVVVKDVVENDIVAGNPAKSIKRD